MAEKWPSGIIFKKHTRKSKRGEIEEVSVPYVRVRYTDAAGRRHAIWQQVENPAHARRVRAALTTRFETEGAEAFAHARKTFDDLADEYKRLYLKEAVFVDGRKVAGRRSLVSAQAYLKALREHFGGRRLRALTFGSIEHYKQARLAAPVVSRPKQGEPKTHPRSIASVQRELAFLRAMLNFAVRERWLQRNPFNDGTGLISAADERQRERIVTLEEERALLNACAQQKRGAGPRLRLLIVCALETGMRFGEMKKMTWRQVDFASGFIQILSTHTKTQRARQVKMSKRLAQEIGVWRETTKIPVGQDDLVFGIRSNVKTAWCAARERAGLPDVRFHDLRHTNATRLERSKRVSLAQLARQLGHSDPKTTYRYVNQDIDSLEEAARVLDEMHEEAAAKEKSAPVN